MIRPLSVNRESIKKESVPGESDLIRKGFKRKLFREPHPYWPGRKETSILYTTHDKETWAFGRSQQKFLTNNGKMTGILFYIYKKMNSATSELRRGPKSQMRTAVPADVLVSVR